MKTGVVMTNDKSGSARRLLQTQRSHVLITLSHPVKGSESAFLSWYQGAYHAAVQTIAGVLSVRHYEQHEADITRGRYPPTRFQYLGIYELSVDGADAADDIIERITMLHREQAAVQAPATWLYYPASEKVGRSPLTTPFLILAFANGVPGQENEFREWYATRHIRHALVIPAIVSGQCFERTLFQRPGAQEANFATIAMYEQEGTPEDVIESFKTLPKDALYFPMLDRSRFTECAYRPIDLSKL